MLWVHFSNKTTYRAVVASITYQYTDDSEALVNPALQLKVLARYAKAGVERLDQEFGDAVSTPRDGLLSFIADYEDTEFENEERDLIGESQPCTRQTPNSASTSYLVVLRGRFWTSWSESSSL